MTLPDLPDGVTVAAGRLCPSDYRYPPAIFDRAPDLTAQTLYVVGGLYGNAEALDALERMASAEPSPPVIVFNGDFHWFDAEPAWFEEIAFRIARHPAIRGNVETEIARTVSVGAGCGCAYPPSVDQGTVARSNAILSCLQASARACQGATERLARLPMHLVAEVGGCRIAIVHGDAHALAGWSFAHAALDEAGAPERMARIAAAARVDVFASTHTCLAALRRFVLPGGGLTIVNNGAAGMPNFTGDRRGLFSRIGLAPGPHPALYGVRHGPLCIDALPLAYDSEAFLRRFQRRWPAGSAAAISYRERIMAGPVYTVAQARPRAPAREPANSC